MNRNGFTILRLRAEDTTLPPAEILFRPGLNVIAGDSNTGKSYLRQCIDFMLGSDILPKNIDEAKPYVRLVLEIQDRTDHAFTLERSLKGGQFHLYECPFLAITHTIPRIVTTKGKETLSPLLLALCGINTAKIRVNDKGNTETLTFRTMSHLFVIDEATIITENSPINLPVAQAFTKTKAKALFNYLLTGKDDSSLIPLPDKKIAKAQQAAKQEVYDNLIVELEQKINSRQPKISDVREEIDRLKRRVEVLTQEISLSHQSILKQQQYRQENWRLQKEKESRIIVIDELLKRFDLLRQHYHSDLERLDFISEGDNFFDQLDLVLCPVCGSSLEEHSRKRMCVNMNGDPKNLMEACREEMAKITTYLHDLESTVAEMRRERQEVVEEINKLVEIVALCDNQLSQELKPKQIIEQAELEQLLLARSALSELEVNVTQLQEFRKVREVVQKSPSAKSSTIKGQPIVDRRVLRQLGNIIEDILGKWKFADNGTVEFDEQTMDFIVNGKPRETNGKGVRALIHSAVAIGLMKFCKQNALPHPGFVILDSPLTTLREKQQDVISEEVSGEIQKAFFEHLAETPQDEQIIILENKVPPENVKWRINYLEFRKEGDGRKGFYPPLNTAK